jgi:DUF971 family protein
MTEVHSAIVLADTPQSRAGSLPQGSTQNGKPVMIPTDIKLHKASKTLTLKYASGEEYHLPAEFLRVHSPSAEVQGHGKPILQFGKIGVGLTKVEPAGQYALKLTFDDGHDSGLFTWEYLYQLAVRQEDLWSDYLAELKAAGKTRDPNESVVKLML